MGGDGVNTMHPIGIFDSGLGGISVLKCCQKIMPNEHFVYYADAKYAPYGEKSKQEIFERCQKIVAFLLEKQCKIIILACNSATAACIETLRNLYPQIPFIGMEPALKLAVHNKVSPQKVLVLATTITLKEEKFTSLMQKYSQEHVIYKQACPQLVELVENHELLDESKVLACLHGYVSAYLAMGISSIVLGCTHFVFFKPNLLKLCGDEVVIFDGNLGTAKQVKAVLNTVLRTEADQGGKIEFFTSTSDSLYMESAKELLNRAL